MAELQPTTAQKTVLALGLKHIPRHSHTRDEALDSLSKSLLQYVRRLKIGLHFSAHGSEAEPLYPRVRNSAWMPPANAPTTRLIDDWYWRVRKKIDETHVPLRNQLSWQDKQLQRTLRELQELNVVIKPADKNLGTVLLTAASYHTLCMKHLDDTTTYRKEDCDSDQCYTVLRSILDRHGKLFNPYDNGYTETATTSTTADRHSHSSNKRPIVQRNTTQKRQRTDTPRKLTPLAESLLQLQGSAQLRLSYFYIMPKMHKATLAGRPIVSTIDSVTYHTSKYLHNVLAQALPYLGTVVRSTQHALTQLLRTPLPPHCVLLCADVTSLYPSIPIEYGIAAVQSVLERFTAEIRGFPRININFTMDLLQWVLTNNYFTYLDDTYLQLSGTAMGTPLAVMYANIVLFHLETAARALGPPLYMRFIDDLAVVCSSTAQARNIVAAFNSQCPSIQLEAVTIDSTGIFLDLHLDLQQYAQCTRVITRTYQKPINKYLYLTPRSNHQRSIFANFVYNEFCRYRLQCTRPEDFRSTAKLFTERLLRRGYNRRNVNKILSSIPSRSELRQRMFARKQLPSQHRTPLMVIDRWLLSFIPDLKQLARLDDEVQQHPVFNQVYGATNTQLAVRNEPSIMAKLCNQRRTTTQVQNWLPTPIGKITGALRAPQGSKRPSGDGRTFCAPNLFPI